MRRQADNTCSRGAVMGRDVRRAHGVSRSAAIATWGGAGDPACARRSSQGAVQALPVARGRYLAENGTLGGSIARSIVARTHGGRRAMQAACVLRDGWPQPTSRVSAEHGSPRLTSGELEVLRNSHWSKLTSVYCLFLSNEVLVVSLRRALRFPRAAKRAKVLR